MPKKTASFAPRRIEAPISGKSKEKTNGEINAVNFDRSRYLKRVEEREKRSPLFKNCFFAFTIGGGICVLGQLLLSLYLYAGLSERDAGTLVTVSLIFLSAVLTGIGVFDNIARVAGAGTLVPVTGFANAVVSPALDNKSEGLVMGVGAKIFVIAGPVLLYATLSGAVYGVIYYVVGLLL